MKMEIKQINKKKLITKALEDGIKKTVELLIVGIIIGIISKILILTILGVVGGSLYFKTNQTNSLGLDITRVFRR